MQQFSVCGSSPADEGLHLPRENYKFAQRKRELDKKRKKEEKAQRKAAERAAQASGQQPAEDGDVAAGAPVPAEPEPKA